MCHNEVACITAGIAMYSVILDKADAIAQNGGGTRMDPEDELMARLPALLAQLSAEARALIREHHDHGTDLIAGLHCALRV